MNSLSNKRLFVLLAWIVASLLASMAYGSFSFGLMASIIVNMTPILLLSLAAGVIISCGEIDIALGGLLGLLGTVIVFFSGIFTGSLFFVALIHLCVFVAIVFYYWAFSAVVNLGLSSLIVSISVLLVSKGLSTLLQSCIQGVGEFCRGENVNGGRNNILNQDYLFSLASEPVFAILVIVSVVSALLYIRHKTVWGLEHIAVGMNHKSAMFARVSISSVRRRAFLVCGVLVFFAMFMRLHGQNAGGWSANTGWGEEILAIAIAVIGGTKITGGRFQPIAIGLATFAVFLTRDIITNDLGVPTEVASIVFGMALLAILAMDIDASSMRREQF